MADFALWVKMLVWIGAGLPGAEKLRPALWPNTQTGADLYCANKPFVSNRQIATAKPIFNLGMLLKTCVCLHFVWVSLGGIMQKEDTVTIFFCGRGSKYIITFGGM